MKPIAATLRNIRKLPLSVTILGGALLIVSHIAAFDAGENAALRGDDAVIARVYYGVNVITGQFLDTMKKYDARMGVCPEPEPGK